MWTGNAPTNWRSWRSFDAGGHVSISGRIDRITHALVFSVAHGGTIELYRYDGALAGAHIVVPQIAGRFDMTIGLVPITGEQVLVLQYSFRSGPHSYMGDTRLVALVSLRISL